MSELPFAFEVRRATDGDVGFVVSSWLESYHQGSRAGRLQRFSAYRPHMRDLVKRLLARATTLVACAPDERDHLFGWVVGEPLDRIDGAASGGSLLHYVYVREMRRKVGLASALLAKLTSTHGPVAAFTHETDVALRIARTKWTARTLPHADFNPFLIEKRSKESAA